MVYNVSFGVAAVCILIIIVFCVTFRISNNSVQSKRFRNLIIAMLFAAFFDTISGITINDRQNVPVWINNLINTIDFAVIISAIFCYSRYIDILVHGDGNENKTMVFFNRCVYGVYLILLAANSFLGFIFDFDSEGNYLKTEFYFLIYLLPLYYTIYTSILLIYNHRKYERKQIIAISSFCPMLIIGAILQLIFPYVLITMFVSTLSLIVILFFLETPDYQKLNNTMIELDKAKQEAIKASKAKSEFLSNMSHEIRTPINAVLGMNEMIMRESSEKQIVEYAANIQSAGRTLLSIINDILDFSKIESGKMEIVPVSYDVSSFVNDIVNMIKIRAEKKKLGFFYEIDENIPSVLYGDDVRIRQVITNILTNAVKYTPEGYVRLRMNVVNIENDILRLEVSVTDTGIGIKEEDMDKLFTSFQRLDQEKNRSIEGTGLGIPIVQCLLDMMGSKLKVSSVYGSGSTFSFELEQKIVKPEPIGDFEQRFKAAATEHTSDVVVRIAPRAKVLVVDDNQTNLLVAKSLLKRTKVNLDTAPSGAKCIELLKSKRYDIVFLDHMMPEMDGIETLKKVKEENLAPDTCFVALTANAIHGARQAYLDAGFDDYLSKPFTGMDIEKCLFGHISKSLCEEETQITKEKAEENSPKPAETEVNTLFSPEEGAKYTGGDNEAYNDILSLYVRKAPELSQRIERLFNEKNWKNYVIEVHALKSSSLTIGSKQLSELAKELELSGKAGNYAVIEEKNGELLALYKKVAELGKEYLGETDTPKQEAPAENVQLTEIAAEKAREYLEAIKEACLSFDTDEAERLCGEIMGCSVNGEPLKPVLDEILAAVEDFEYEAAAAAAEKFAERCADMLVKTGS